MTYLEVARKIAPLIEAEADAAEERRDVSPEVIDALRVGGLFWMLVPAEFGGGDLDIASFIEAVEELGRADGSTGWVLMATAVNNRNFSLYMDGRDRLFGDGSCPIIAGTATPRGKAVAVDGGYIISSTDIPFGSGIRYATHVSATLPIFEKDGVQRRTSTGSPEFRTCLVPSDQIRIKGNWNVSGLVGTGSFDYDVPEQFVPDDFTMLYSGFWGPGSRTEGVILDRTAIGTAGHSGLALGLIRRSLQELANIVAGKKRMGYSTSVDKDPHFLAEFALHEASYQAARSFALHTFRSAEQSAKTRGFVSADLNVRLKQVNTYVHMVGAKVTSFAQLWGGTQAVRNPSALGRAVRDMGIAKTHLFVDPNTMVAAAPTLLESWRSSGRD